MSLRVTQIDPSLKTMMIDVDKAVPEVMNAAISRCSRSSDAVAVTLTGLATAVAAAAAIRHLTLRGSSSEAAPHMLAVLDEIRKDIETNMTTRTVQ